MKSIHKFIIALSISAGASITSCQKLDIAPTNIFTPQIILGTEAGVNSMLATIYRALPIEDFKYRPDGGEDNNGIPHPGFNPLNPWMNFYHSGAVTGELVGPFGGMDIGGGFGYWPYANIRNVNILITELPKYAAQLTQPKVDALLGEAHFLRAYFYFALAKRYGGIPIISTVQDPGAPLSELQVHRDKEEATWDFIGAELDLGYQMMPDVNPAGRANKYVAAALKSRAMLYAGCIAKYGSANYVDGEAKSLGYVGIPADKAQGYFTKAYDAAKLLEGHYSLYEKNADKVQNYVDLFLKSDSPENIFIKQYSIATNTAHSWDATMSPRYMTANALSRAYPTLDLIQRWGTLPITNADGTPKRFDNRADLMQGLEPRLLATVYFPGATLRGLTFDAQRGIYPSFSGTAASEVAKQPNSRSYVLAGDTKTLYQGKMVIGFTGLTSAADDAVSRTGFYVRKYIDYAKSTSEADLYKSQQPRIDMRYAEVLLNRAEADVELGNVSDALTCINQIRNRAGASQLGNVTIDDVRNERCKELAFENHYYWDLKRWRIADVVLNNARFKGLMPYYVFNENKYIFLAEPELFQRNYNFDKRFYYEPIPGGELGKNPNLYPNNPNY
jgi:hypothetical protein